MRQGPIPFRSVISSKTVALAMFLLVAAIEVSGCHKRSNIANVVIPNPGVWKITSQSSESPSRHVEFAFASGDKWRMEMAAGKGVVLAVYDGKTFKSIPPGLSKEGGDPVSTLLWFAKDAIHPKSAETIEQNGRKYIAYHCDDEYSTNTITVDFYTHIPTHSTGTAKGATMNMEIGFIPYDLKDREAELFDVSNLKPLTPTLLPGETFNSAAGAN
jgi:hypothetical protein